jgi:hypothetical protein
MSFPKLTSKTWVYAVLAANSVISVASLVLLIISAVSLLPLEQPGCGY